jgi:hypothetical protein
MFSMSPCRGVILKTTEKSRAESTEESADAVQFEVVQEVRNVIRL